MADDIVTRLRASIDGDYFGSREDMKEAVAEIERLQQLVEHLSAQLRLQIKANDKAWEAYKEVTGDE